MTKLTGNTYYQRATFKFLGFKWVAEEKAWVSEKDISEFDLNKIKAMRGVIINGIANAVIAKPKPVKMAKPKQADLLALIEKLHQENLALKQTKSA